MSSQDGTLEETLGQVEEIIRQMEESEVSLETSFQLYQQGLFPVQCRAPSLFLFFLVILMQV